ncbi:hypothetical protein QE152_g9290 [Popillia japonica]|uniref:Uncharacterized protein n=1 Tax=Popillia japonica TaxID=7064 RepID=A0AAW1LZF6_POPJA
MAAASTAAPTTPIMSFMDLIRITDKIDELPQQLQRWGLIPIEGDYKCPTCGNSLKLERFQDSIDGSVWKCYQKISFRKQARRVCGTRTDPQN